MLESHEVHGPAELHSRRPRTPYSRRRQRHHQAKSRSKTPTILFRLRKTKPVNRANHHLAVNKSETALLRVVSHQLVRFAVFPLNHHFLEINPCANLRRSPPTSGPNTPVVGFDRSTDGRETAQTII